MEGFTYVNYDGDPTNQQTPLHDTVCFEVENLVSWKSKKQNVVSRKSAKCETKATAEDTIRKSTCRNWFP